MRFRVSSPKDSIREYTLTNFNLLRVACLSKGPIRDNVWVDLCLAKSIGKTLRSSVANFRKMPAGATLSPRAQSVGLCWFLMIQDRSAPGGAARLQR